jgi:hypothetical protein
MGNAIAGKGRRFGWPVVLEVLEGVEIDFDKNGEPELPKMISDRDISRNPLTQPAARSLRTVRAPD